MMQEATTTVSVITSTGPVDLLGPCRAPREGTARPAPAGRWALWDAPEDWGCQFLRHLDTDLLYDSVDGYLVGWMDAAAGTVDLFDAPIDE